MQRLVIVPNLWSMLIAALAVSPHMCWAQSVADDASSNSADTAGVVSDYSGFKAEIEAFLDKSPSQKPSAKTEAAASDRAPEGSPESEMLPFIRVRQSDDGELLSLDTAVVRYVSPSGNGVTVDLIGAVHVAEKPYYVALNQLFDDYDVLLYELVAPEGTVIPRGGKREEQGFNPVAMLQDGARSMLGLESQLECIDYTKPHFVRADMSPEQIAQKMSERGDTAFTLALDTLADVMRQQNLAAKESDMETLFDLEQELTLSDMLGNPLKMKRLMAQQFATAGSLDAALGDALNQLLIVDRNAQALRVLQKQIAAGEKRIGIFYGAAHLADFEMHLVNDFGLRRESVRWLPAWDLTSSQQSELSEPTSLLLNLLKILE